MITLHVKCEICLSELISYFADFVDVRLQLKFYYSNPTFYVCNMMLLCGRCIRLLHCPSYDHVVTNA